MTESTRIIEKLDAYLQKNDLQGARRHLEYWELETREPETNWPETGEEAIGRTYGSEKTVREAEYRNGTDGAASAAPGSSPAAGGVKHGEKKVYAAAESGLRVRLTVLNELIGLYRKLGLRELCMKTSSEALELTERLGLAETVTGATVLLNGATGCKAFGKPQEAVVLYEKARAVYENLLPENDARLGGLYNNMALALTETKDYERAGSYFEKALKTMAMQEHGEPEQAVTCLNLADLAAVRTDLTDMEAVERIESYLNRAEELLEKCNAAGDGNYAYVCEKCAPVFDHYGRKETAQRLVIRAAEIYGRNRKK